MRGISIICLLLSTLLAGCAESPQAPDDYYSPDVPPGVNVYYYDWSDGIAPDTVYFLALVGEWNRVDTLFYMLAEGERVIVENWFIDNNVELAVAYDPLEDIEYVWRAWMAGDTAQLVWTP
jgi:hypothetical protein